MRPSAHAAWACGLTSYAASRLELALPIPLEELVDDLQRRTAGDEFGERRQEMSVEKDGRR
jgi:hypothetical protein